MLLNGLEPGWRCEAVDDASGAEIQQVVRDGRLLEKGISQQMSYSKGELLSISLTCVATITRMALWRCWRMLVVRCLTKSSAAEEP